MWLLLVKYSFPVARRWSGRTLGLNIDFNNIPKLINYPMAENQTSLVDRATTSSNSPRAHRHFQKYICYSHYWGLER